MDDTSAHGLLGSTQELHAKCGLVLQQFHLNAEAKTAPKHYFKSTQVLCFMQEFHLKDLCYSKIHFMDASG
jgi:hypothetical protein